MNHTLRSAVEQLERRDTPATLYSLTDDNRIVSFDSSNPAAAHISAPINVGSSRWRVAGLAYRPRTGELHALILERASLSSGQTGVNAMVYDLHLLTTNVSGYLIPRTFIGTTPIGSTDYDADFNAAYGFSFDPTTDQVRITSSRGFNGRFDLWNQLATTDRPVSPAGQTVHTAAYDRNFDGKLGPNGTTLYTLNATAGTLQTQGRLNDSVSSDDGIQATVGPLGTPIDASGWAGLAIPARPTAGGSAFAVFDGDPGAGRATGLYTIDLSSGAATLVGLVGNGTAKLGALAVAPVGRFAAGSGPGTDSKVEVYNAVTSARLQTFNPFPGFFGGVAVATGDVSRDTVPDVVVGALAGGGPHVKVYDGASGAELYSFFAFDHRFRGGVSVSCGDINADGYADLLVGAGPGGGPHVRAFSGKDLSDLASFMAYDVIFAGGVSVAAGDFDQDGAAEMVTGAGPGGGPHVRLFARDRLTGTTAILDNPRVPIFRNFFAFDVNYRGGVNVAVGYVEDNNPFLNVVTAPATGGSNLPVQVHSALATGPNIRFTPFDTGDAGGVRVGAADVNGDGQREVIVGGPGTTVRAFVTGYNPPTALLKAFDVLPGANDLSVG